MRVKYNHLFRECVGDQYVVWCDFGLNHMDHTFIVSPNYFDYNEYDKLVHIAMKRKVESWVKDSIIKKFLTASLKFLFYMCFLQVFVFIAVIWMR